MSGVQEQMEGYSARRAGSLELGGKRREGQYIGLLMVVVTAWNVLMGDRGRSICGEGLPRV